MKPAGWIFMLTAWGAILTLAGWCVWKIVLCKERKKPPSGEHSDPAAGEMNDTR